MAPHPPREAPSPATPALGRWARPGGLSEGPLLGEAPSRPLAHRRRRVLLHTRVLVRAVNITTLSRQTILFV